MLDATVISVVGCYRPGIRRAQTAQHVARTLSERPGVVGEAIKIVGEAKSAHSPHTTQ